MFERDLYHIQKRPVSNIKEINVICKKDLFHGKFKRNFEKAGSIVMIYWKSLLWGGYD